MSFSSSDLSFPADFSNPVRLFPLPNVVLFPGVIQGLHIFEPRYRRLMEDALIDDQLITMAVYEPMEMGELLDFEMPPMFPTVCVGKVMTHAKMPDGRYNLLLLGVKRARMIEEPVTDLPYRTAQIELIDDIPNSDLADEQQLRKALVNEFNKLAAVQNLENNPVQAALSEEVPIGMLADMICFSIGAPVEQQMKVLATPGIAERTSIVLGMLRERNSMFGKSNSPNFPPDFSLN